MKRRLQLFCCTLILFAAAAGNAFAESAAETGSSLEWSITPYLWLADTSFELRASGQDIGAGDVDFGELVDTLDGAFQIVAEAGRDHWSGFVDFTYLSTSDSERIELPGAGSLKVSTTSDQLFADAAIAFWPWPDVSGFNVYAGIRYTDLDDRIRVDLVNPETRLGRIDADRSYTDALIGFRDRFRLTENWAAIIRMDYGFGDSDGVFLAQAILRWAVGQQRRHGIVLGYRYKDAEFKKGDREERYKYQGPLLGFNFRF